MMYLATVNTDTVSQTSGLTYIRLVNSAERPVGFDYRFTQTMWNIVRFALPIKIKQSIAVQACIGGKEHLLDFVRYRTAKFMEHNSRLKVDQVSGSSVTAIAKKLEQRGLEKIFLPSDVGGDFCMETNLLDWTRARLSVEELTSTKPNAFDVAFKPSSESNTGRPDILVKGKRDEPETEADFCKKRNALYSRRMYHKRKLALLSLQEEVWKWEDLNEKLRQDNQHLEQLLWQAQNRLANHGIPMNLAYFGTAPTEPAGALQKPVMFDLNSSVRVPTLKDPPFWGETGRHAMALQAPGGMGLVDSIQKTIVAAPSNLQYMGGQNSGVVFNSNFNNMNTAAAPNLQLFGTDPMVGMTQGSTVGLGGAVPNTLMMQQQEPNMNTNVPYFGSEMTMTMQPTMQELATNGSPVVGVEPFGGLDEWQQQDTMPPNNSVPNSYGGLP